MPELSLCYYRMINRFTLSPLEGYMPQLDLEESRQTILGAINVLLLESIYVSISLC